MVRMLDGLRFPGLHALALLLILITHIGCGRVDGYPETTVTSPLGRAGICVACSKGIDSVGKTHLVTSGGTQFIVCSEACAEKAGGDAEHTH